MIYFIQAGDSGPIKIGFVRDEAVLLEKRVRNLQVGNPERLCVRAVLPGDQVRESALHTHFREGRLLGEWFRRDTPGLLEMIELAVESHTLIVSGRAKRYCSWCQIRTVADDRRTLCGDECAHRSDRGKRSPGLPNRSPRDSGIRLQMAAFMETAGIEPAQDSPRDGDVAA